MNFASDLVYAQGSDSEDESVCEAELDERNLEDDDEGAGDLFDAEPMLAAAAAPPPPSAAAAPMDDARQETPAVAAGGGGGGGFGERITSTIASLFGRVTTAAEATNSRPPPAPRQRRADFGGHDRGGRRVAQHMDTNVVSLSFSALATKAAFATGDPVFCGKCGAMLSCHSTLVNKEGAVVSKGPKAPTGETPAASDAAAAGGAGAPPPAASTQNPEESAAAAAPAPAPAGLAPVDEEASKLDDSDQLWRCEFCLHRNVVTLDEEEIPTEQTVDYILEAPSVKTTSRSEDDGMLIFCLDISGSMCVTSAIAGKHNLKGDRSTGKSGLRAHGDSHDQFMPGESRNITYVSRLQALQGAVTTLLDSLKDERPNTKVGLVTFAGEVTIVGDGSSTPKVLTGTRLQEAEQLRAAGEAFELTGSIKSTHTAVTKAVLDLEEGGPTALGPALVAALAMAGRCRGSKVVVVTDGLANVGLGSLEDRKEGDTSVAAFYDALGTEAAAKGVIIDVIGIEGEHCDVETLSAMVETSGGEITKVDPTNLTKSFTNVMAVPLIASEVEATIMLHSGLKFRNADDATIVGNKMLQSIGNVTADTEITFEYRVKTSAELAADGLSRSALNQLPFQVQIKYRKMDGTKCVRAITQTKRVTTERATAEAVADYSVLGTHAEQVSAKAARKGDYTESRGQAMLWNRYMKGNARTEEQRSAVSAFSAGISPMYNAIQSEVAVERSAVASATSAEDLESSRRTRRTNNDGLSAQIHKAKKASRSRYTPA